MVLGSSEQLPRACCLLCAVHSQANISMGSVVPHGSRIENKGVVVAAEEEQSYLLESKGYFLVLERLFELLNGTDIRSCSLSA